MTEFDEEFWEERYRSHQAVWSRQPNTQLVAEAAGLPPGRALDAGCGEGADAIWLADRGWQVTAVDFATAALRKAADHAAAAGVTDRIEWRHADLTAWTPEEAAYDLVSAQFVHLPQAAERLFVRLAEAVAPGGTLLVVGHDPSDLETAAHRAAAPERFFSADDVAAKLDPAKWLIEVAEARPRLSKHHEGDNITVHDAVLRAQRRAASEAPTRDRSPRGDSTLNVATQRQKSA
jgi:trans-aconitate methyltransferase